MKIQNKITKIIKTAYSNTGSVRFIMEDTLQNFSSTRRNHILSSHRKDGLIEWIKNMLNHSFVLDAAETYADTMSHFEVLVEEHKKDPLRSRLKQYIPSIGIFHTR